jgi:hypothetical protein
MTEQKLQVQIQGCLQAHEAEIEQAVENAFTNLMALVEGGDMEFDSPEDMAHVAEQMIRASMDRMGIEDVVGLSITCVAVT